MALRQRPRDRVDPYEEDSGRGSWLPLVVAVIALLGLGAWIGRASQPHQQPATPPATTTPEDDAPIDWPGPTDTENGIPVGYPRTEDGAVAAAVQHTTILGQAHGERLAEVLDVVAGSDAREDFRVSMEEPLRQVHEGLGLSPNDPDFVGIAGHVGYIVDSYAETAATVRVWGVGFIVDPALGAPRVGAADSSWTTTTIGLEWERGDWRLTGFHTTDGPSPEDANTGDPRRTARSMKEFKELWHVPPLR